MRTFKIHFTRNRKGAIFSRLLQWYERLPISHVSVEFNTPHLGQNFIYHSAIGNGVSFMTKKRFEKANEIMETYEVTLEDMEYIAMRNDLLDNCGESYATMQNLGILLVDMARRKGLPMANPWKDGQNCSELIYRHVMPYLVPILWGSYDPDLVKPSEIRKLLKMYGIKPIFSKIEDK
jgi:hypothetical protein